MNIHSAKPSGFDPIAGAETNLVFDANRIVGLLAFLALSIVVFGAFANIMIFQIAEHEEAVLAKIMRRFDLGFEPSIPAWFSSVLLFANAVWLLLTGAATRKMQQPFAGHWTLLGLIFIALSIDEAVMFHEMIDNFLLQVIPQSSALIFPWVVVGGAFALTIFLFFLKFLLNLELRIGKLFVLSGVLFVGGAVGVEFLAGHVIDAYGVASVQHAFVQTIEEGLEISGSLLFFYSLWQHWNSKFEPLQVKLGSRN